jgi:hypothetical protein
MKKYLMLLATVLFAVISYGQDISVKELAKSADWTFDINKNETYNFFYGDEVTDTIDASDTWSRNYVVKNVYDALKQECRVKLDSVSGSPSVTVTLEGKYSYNDSYTSIATATWSGTSSDTTIILQGTTAKPYRILNFKAVADATTQKVQIERVELGVFK